MLALARWHLRPLGFDGRECLMGAVSGIEWLVDENGRPGSTWNFVAGCSHVSPGCRFCYAETIARRFSGTAGFPNGFRVTLHPGRWFLPLRWREGRRIFVNSTSDVFHEDIACEVIVRAWAIMALAPRHTFIVLTKRADRMQELLSRSDFPEMVAAEVEALAANPEVPLNKVRREAARQAVVQWPLPNVWLGVSAENQEWAEHRIPLLQNTPAAVRLVSLEPLIAPIDLDLPRCEIHNRADIFIRDGEELCGSCVSDGWRGELSHGYWLDPLNGGLNWVLVGGESGAKARVMDPQWARDLRDQCIDAGVGFHFKQFGAWAPAGSYGIGVLEPGRVYGTAARELGAGVQGREILRRVGKKAAGRELDGRLWNESPATLATIA
ncbi:DUF5131 family protein [Mycolicibacterium llatzerense]|uniref:DUF5131 family protein n=1 Tax=Mycolicibacterium llatzerense TaxID=280871 RepID=UPI001F41909C|nr:phage Gp37/Gp68 family protein [Mycolicibacterium llatzerense]